MILKVASLSWFINELIVCNLRIFIQNSKFRFGNLYILNKYDFDPLYYSWNVVNFSHNNWELTKKLICENRIFYYDIWYSQCYSNWTQNIDMEIFSFSLLLYDFSNSPMFLAIIYKKKFSIFHKNSYKFKLVTLLNK